eukprot:superscaffoldBa00001302_g9987
MAAAYRVVVSSVSCYNSVVVDRRTHSHAVHYCSGPCGALSQGLDCTVAHHGTCSELLVSPDPAYTDPNSSPIHSRNIITQQLPNHGKMSVTMETSYNGGVGLERAGSSGNLSLGEDSPTWRGKKTPSWGGSTGNLTSSSSLKDITEEAINLASGKLKEFSFDKLRLSSSSHVTFRKGRKVRPDSFSRRSTDLEIIYGHFSSNITTNGTANGMTNGTATSNDENLPPFVLGKGTGMEETKLKGNSGTLSSITKVGSGSTSSLSSISSASLDQSLSTMASLYRNTLGDENLIARLLEKTCAEAGSGGAGGEDIRACLDILLKCSEDLKKCTDIIKQCIRRKAGGGPEDGGASPDSVYRAMMTRLSSYLKRLPLELEGIGILGGSGQGGQGAPGSGHSDLAELLNNLHSLQQGPFSPIFGNEQPPRYEDVVHSPPIPKTVTHSASSTPASVSSSSSSLKSDSIHTKPVLSSSSRATPLTNGLQHPHPSITQHTLSPPSVICSQSSSSPTHSPSPHHTSPTPPYTHTPPASPMEALYIEEEEADVGKTPEQIAHQTNTPTRGLTISQNKNGTMLSQHMHTLHNSSNSLPTSTGHSPSWPPSASLAVSAPKAVTHRNDDIDKLLLDLENLSQSMSHPRDTEPPLPAKTRKRDGGQGITSNEALTQPKMAQFQIQKPASHLAMNGSTSRVHQGLTPPQGENSDAVVGEEEDGALLLRILESIESFAQELVDSGAGSTGSAERNSGKEREVMRLLQDTLATTGRADTPVESTNTPAAPNAPSIHITTVPDIPPKHSLAHTPVASPAPTPVPAVTEDVCMATSEPAPKPTPDAAPKSLPAPIPEPTTEATDKATEASTGEAHPESIPAPVTPAPAILHSSTHSAEPTPVAAPETPTPVAIPTINTIRDAAITVGDPAAVRDTGSTLLIQQTPEVIRVMSGDLALNKTRCQSRLKHRTSKAAETSILCQIQAHLPGWRVGQFRHATVSVAVSGGGLRVSAPTMMIKETSLRRDPDLRGELAFLARGCDFVLPSRFKKRLKSFQQQQVQSKSEKKPGTPPPAPAPATASPAPTPRSPSPPPTPVIVTPPPPAINIPRFYYPRGLPALGLVPNHDAAIAAIETAFTEFEEEKADIYEMGKIAKDIVDTHPGLTFLKDAPEFHSRYITTVIQRIFYVVNRSWTGRITMMELRRSNFLQTLALLEEEDDINQITDYFSYEHFYVIYCKFWELDTDHDLYIDPKDLARYNDHASSNRIIERLFSGAVTRGNAVQREGRMSYAEFVWFLISEEDKKNPTSVFVCKITLGDLKRCRMAHIFFDTFFNLEKYLDHEQRDPFAVQKDIDSEGPEPSDWDKYASEEYEILVAEETANEQLHEGSFDDDYESEELQVPGEIGNKMEKLVISDLSA